MESKQPKIQEKSKEKIYLKKKRKISGDIFNPQEKIIKLNFIYSINKAFNDKDISKETDPLYLLKGSYLIKSRNKALDILNCIKNEELCFDISRERALEMIKSIDNLKEKAEVIKQINNSLAYDNTNEYIIYSAYKRNFELNFVEENCILLKKYRFLLHKSIFIKDENKSDNNIFIPENEKSIKSDFISILKILIKLGKYYNAYTLKNLNIELSIKLKIENEQIIIISNNKSGNNKIDTVLKIVNDFSIFLQKYKTVNDFRNNQPIKYELNPILYFSTFINNIFDIFLIKKYQKNEEYEYKINKRKINQILYIENFIDNKIINELVNTEHITFELDKVIKLLLFNLDSKHRANQLIFGENIHFRKNDSEILTLEYFKNNEQKDNLINGLIAINPDGFTINYNNNHYLLNYLYDNYPKSIVSKIYNSPIPKIPKLLYEECFFDSFQKSNFFTQKEIDYMKYLIREIIDSKLFNELFQIYSEKSSVCSEFIKDKKIQDYIIDNIIFLPYSEKDFDTQSITLKQSGEILISGYPYNDESEYKSFEIHHILENGRKIIIIIHELTHCFKIYLSIATNGIINLETRDDEEKKIEAGFLTEHVLFGWDYKDYKNHDENLFKGNENLKNKKLDIKTSLLLLDPKLYNNDISSFRNIIYNKIESEAYINYINGEKNQKYKEFLSQMGYETEQNIEELIKEKATISIARKNSINNEIDAVFGCGNDKERYFQ